MRLPVKSPVLVFHRSKQELIFLTIQMQKKLKTIGAYTESTALIFKTLKKNYSSRDTVPLKKKAMTDLQ
jgi:hypothetical protein